MARTLFAQWLSLVWCVASANCQNSSLGVNVIVVGVDFLQFPKLMSDYDLETWYFDPQVIASPCNPGTFSDDYSGVCRPCNHCRDKEYVTETCSTTTNSICSNCTVCTEHQVEECACNIVTPTCYTGNRVCYTVLPLSIFINVTFTTSTPLDHNQLIEITDKMQTGYVQWLQDVVGAPNATFDALLPLGGNEYVVYFTLPELYQQNIIQVVRTGGPEYFLQGFTYIGLGRRRLLGTFPSFVVTEVGTSCIILTQCPIFFALKIGVIPCTNQCLPTPCPPGFTGDFGLCTPCPANTFKSTYGNATCTNCPPAYTSPVNATYCIAPMTTIPNTFPTTTTTVTTSATFQSTPTTVTTSTTFQSTSNVATTTTLHITNSTTPWIETTSQAMTTKNFTTTTVIYQTSIRAEYSIYLMTVISFISIFFGFCCGYFTPHSPAPVPLPVIPLKIEHHD